MRELGAALTTYAGTIPFDNSSGSSSSNSNSSIRVPTALQLLQRSVTLLSKALATQTHRSTSTSRDEGTNGDCEHVDKEGSSVEFAQTHLLLGMALQQQQQQQQLGTPPTDGDYCSALSHFETAIELQPGHFVAMIYAASLLLQVSEAGAEGADANTVPASVLLQHRAIALLDRALSLQPRNEQASMLRAIANHKLEAGAGGDPPA
jgi:hypothetical protein